MIEVEFTKDFTKRKKGDRAKYDSWHAWHLVKVDKVAKYVKKPKEAVKKTATKKKS